MKFSPKNYQCFEKLFQTLERVFEKISKHFEIGEKNSAAPRVYDPLLSGWISDEALFLVFKKVLLFSFSACLGAGICECRSGEMSSGSDIVVKGKPTR